MFQFQLGGAGTVDQNAGAFSRSNLSQIFYGTTVGAEWQFKNNLFLGVNTGFCQFSESNGTRNPLSNLGAKVEYRFDPKLSMQLAYDPATRESRVFGWPESRRLSFAATEFQLLIFARVALLIRRAIVIANPASRQGKRLAEQARKTLASRSIDCDVVFTERPGHAAELAVQHAPNYDALFALGGDGTVMEVAGAVSGERSARRRAGRRHGKPARARARHSVVDSARDSRAARRRRAQNRPGSVRFGAAVRDRRRCGNRREHGRRDAELDEAAVGRVGVRDHWNARGTSRGAQA